MGGKREASFPISSSSCNRGKAASRIHLCLDNTNEFRFPSDPAEGMEKVSPGWAVLLKVTCHIGCSEFSVPSIRHERETDLTHPGAELVHSGCCCSAND